MTNFDFVVWCCTVGQSKFKKDQSTESIMDSKVDKTAAASKDMEPAKEEHSTHKGGQGLRKEQHTDSGKKSTVEGTNGRLAVGTKVEMLFADGIWYQGTIERYNPRSGRYTIEFPDGDVQTARLPDKDVRVLGESIVESQGKAVKLSTDCGTSKTPKRKYDLVSEPLNNGSQTESAHKDSEVKRTVARNHDNKDDQCPAGAGSRSLEIGRGPRRSKGEAVEQPDNGLSDSLVGAHVGETADVSLEHVVMGDCLSMLERLRTSRGGHYFAEPVDAEALGLHDYHEIVTEPLDFSTIRERLLSGLYCHRRKGKGSQAFSEKDGIKMRESFGRDVRKVLDNAMLYNPESDRVYKAAASILEFFNTHWQSTPSELLKAGERRVSSPSDSGKRSRELDVKSGCKMPASLTVKEESTNSTALGDATTKILKASPRDKSTFPDKADHVGFEAASEESFSDPRSSNSAPVSAACDGVLQHADSCSMVDEDSIQEKPRRRTRHSCP